MFTRRRANLNQPVSIFIMDVTNSSSENNWNEITDYLQHWEEAIARWCNGIVPAKVSHRRGDEILFVGRHYFTAYTIAFHMSQLWKYQKQKPYFGIACGDVDENMDDIEIEIWNHPLIKKSKRCEH